MTPEARTVLTNVRDLFQSNPATWMQGRLAQNRYGVPVSPNAGSATCFCLGGAIAKYSPQKLQAELEAIAAVKLITGAQSIANWNDAPGRTVADVVKILNITLETA